MSKKIFNLVILFLCIFSFVSCKKTNKVESISVISDSIPSNITTENVETEILKIELNVKYSNKDQKTIQITKKMISESDYQKIKNVGTHQIKINYSGCTTSLTIVVSSNNYSVTIKYPDGNVVSGGITVQWCSSTNCFLPVAINNEGYAEKELEDGTYYVHIDNIPSGYTYNPNAYVTTSDNKHLTIVLDNLSTISSGEGTTASPYVVTSGVYELIFSAAGRKNGQYFSFTATKTGTVNLYSTATDLLAINEINPYLGYIGETDDLVNFNIANADVSGNSDTNINFNYSFNVEAGKTYYFLVFVSSATSFDASFNIYLK